MRWSVQARTFCRLSVSVALMLAACSRPPPTVVPVRPVERQAAHDVVQAALAPIASEIDVTALEIEYPDHDEIYLAGADAFVAGLVRTAAPPPRTDVILVVDTSGSTEAPSGADVDQDGLLGTTSTRGHSDADDSILSAEVVALRAVLGGTNARYQRAGVVSFSGSPYRDRRGDPRAARGKEPGSSQTEVALTDDFDRAGDALDAIALRGGWGLTDIAGALDRAVEELVGGPRAASEPDPDAHHVVIFLTDGTPTLPRVGRRKHNERQVLRAADRAAEAGVRVYSFAIGPDALTRPVAAVEMARRTGGMFMPVRDPALLEAAISLLRMNAFEALTLENRTTGRGPDRLHVADDGSWEALIGLVPGKNRLEARITVDGSRYAAWRTVHYAPGSAQPFVPEDLAARHARLLEGPTRDLKALRRQRMVLELLLRDRQAVEREADAQLKELEPTAP